MNTISINMKLINWMNFINRKLEFKLFNLIKMNYTSILIITIFGPDSLIGV
jgi:hypothetical protein